MAVTRSWLVDEFDAVLFDLDGVVYLGPRPIPHAVEVINALDARGTSRVFVTNNSSRPPSHVSSALADLGIQARPADVVTSAQAAADYLAGKLPKNAAVYVVGGPGLTDALAEVGLRAVRESDDHIAAVVQGFHPDVGWRELAEASYFIARGAMWVASNSDLTLPTDRGLAPGNGSLVMAVANATGAHPVVVGKPFKPTIVEAMSRVGAASPLVVGDRLDTDIEAGHRAGVASLLVLTGVSGVVDVCRAPELQRPTYIGRDLRTLLETYESVDQSGSGYLCGDWLLDGSGTQTEVVQRGADPVLGIRALAALSWSSGIDQAGERLAEQLARELASE